MAKAQVGSGKKYDSISSKPIEGAKLVPERKFHENQITTTVAKAADFGPGLAGGSEKRFYEIRRKQMKGEDWVKPVDANKDELPGEQERDDIVSVRAHTRKKPD